jgi:hypothetical protein
MPWIGDTGRDAASKLAGSKAGELPHSKRSELRLPLRAGESTAKYFLSGTKLPISLKTKG